MANWCARAGFMRGLPTCSLAVGNRRQRNDADRGRHSRKSGHRRYLAGGRLSCVLFFSLRWLDDGGRFHQRGPVAQPGPLPAPFRGIQGPEDFEVDAAHDAIIVSSTNRRAPKAHPDPRDGLYAFEAAAIPRARR